MKLNPLLNSLFILLLIFLGCKKEVNEENNIPIGWHESMKGKILVTWTPIEGYTDDKIFWIDPNGSTYLTDANQCGHLLEGAGWSPDGTMIVFGCWYGTWIINIDGTGSQNIDSSRSHYPVWSPDGSKIAFGSQNELCILNLENEELMHFDIGFGIPKHLNWTSDGNKIVFEKESLLGTSGWVCIFELVNTSSIDFDEPSFCPDWSPDGDKIAFIMFDDNNIQQIFIADSDGSNKEQLTHSTSHLPGPLSWSPDGKLIVAVCLDGIYVYDLKGLMIAKIKEGSYYTNQSIDWGE